MWFHGGGLTVGHTYSAEGNLDAFAENDVIAVSVEQRLGVFGYLSLPQLSEEQGQRRKLRIDGSDQSTGMDQGKYCKFRRRS